MGLGDFFGGILGLGGDIAAGGWSAAEARKQRQFQERMYKSRYQNQMEDMRKAGLNPMLAFGQTPPGPPSGAMGAINPKLGTDAANSALKWNKMTPEKKLIQGQTAAASASAARDKSQEKLLIEQARAQQLTNVGLEIEAMIDRSEYGQAIRKVKRATSAAGALIPAVGGLGAGMLLKGKRKRGGQRDHGSGVRTPYRRNQQPPKYQLQRLQQNPPHYRRGGGE